MRGQRLSDIQWYLNRSRHIAYMAFLLPGRLSRAECTRLAGELMAAFPRLSCQVDLEKSQRFEDCKSGPAEIVEVLPAGDAFEGLADLVAKLAAPFVPGVKPAFHCSMMHDRNNENTLLFFSAPHSVIEGVDAMKVVQKAPERVRPGIGKKLARALLFLLVLPVSIAQIVVAPLLAEPRHRFNRRILSIDRDAFRRAAREGGVSWQGLLTAMIAAAALGSLGQRLGLPRLLSAAEVPRQASQLDDVSMTFRMRFGLVRLSSDLFLLAKRIDRRLFSMSHRRIALYHLISAGLILHRKLASWLPFLYPDRSFQYFPAAMSFSVMPPARLHRFGRLAQAQFAVAGTNTPGLPSGIVMVFGNRLVLSLNLQGDGSGQLAEITRRLQVMGVDHEVLV